MTNHQPDGLGGGSARAPIDPTTICVPGPKTGGKGGEGDPTESVALPNLKNKLLVQRLGRGAPKGAATLVCSKAGDPENGAWAAEVAVDVDRQCPPDRNNFINCSTFFAADGGAASAKAENFASYQALVLDDVGTKVPRERLGAFKPSWEIQTSPGNAQIGIFLTEPVTNKSAVKVLQDAVVAAGLCDPGAKGVGRWARLPEAINGKAKHRTEGGGPFRCRLVTWNPEVSYTPEEIAAELSFELAPPSPPTAGRPVPNATPTATHGADDDVYTPKAAVNPVVTALQSRGLYKRPNGPGVHEIQCPWVHEHTDALDTGAAYFEPDDHHLVGGFKCQHSHGDQYHLGQLLSYLDIPATAARHKAKIVNVPGEINRVVDAAEHALAAMGQHYQMGGAIVSVRSDPLSGDVSVRPTSEQALTRALSEAAVWEKYDGRSKATVRCDPTTRIVNMVQQAQSYQHLPSLRGLARQPFFREHTRELVAVPGFDRPSGIYAVFDPKEFPLPEPTRGAAEAALERLKALLDEFHFASDVDHSAGLSAMLTAAVRPSLSVAPAFLVTASSYGSGKTYLCSVIHPFAGPGEPMNVSYPKSTEEATKAMLSLLLQAPAAITFDDMDADMIPHGAINRMLTSETITDRILGVSKVVTVSTRTLVMGSGNNVEPVRDLRRRVISIRLAPRTASPTTLRYSGKPAELVRVNRGRYVADALTIVEAWRQAGKPLTDVPEIASFGGAWADHCRHPLIWLGLPDPATSLLEQVQSDPDGEALGHMMQEWLKLVGEHPITLRKLLERADTPAGWALRDAILDLPVVIGGNIDRNKLGWHFKRNADRIVDGCELKKATSAERNAWRVVRVHNLISDAAPAAPPLPPLREPAPD